MASFQTSEATCDWTKQCYRCWMTSVYCSARHNAQFTHNAYRWTTWKQTRRVTSGWTHYGTSDQKAVKGFFDHYLEIIYFAKIDKNW